MGHRRISGFGVHTDLHTCTHTNIQTRTCTYVHIHMLARIHTMAWEVEGEGVGGVFCLGRTYVQTHTRAGE